MSATVLQVLDNIHLVHQSSMEFAKDQLKNAEDSDKQEYLEKESQKLSVFMELYVLLFTKAIPEEGRKYVNYKSWAEAKTLIEKLRGIMNDEQGKG